MKKIFFLLAAFSAPTTYSMFTDAYGFPQTISGYHDPVPMETIRDLYYNEFQWVTFTFDTTDIFSIEMYNQSSYRTNYNKWKSETISGTGHQEIILRRPNTPKKKQSTFTWIRIAKTDGSFNAEFVINNKELGSGYFINTNQKTLHKIA